MEALWRISPNPGNILLFIGGCVNYSSPSAPLVRHQTQFLYGIDTVLGSGNRINVNIPPIEPSRLILEEMLGGVGSNAD